MSEPSPSEWHLPGLPPAELPNQAASPAPVTRLPSNGNSSSPVDDVPNFSSRSRSKEPIRFKIDDELFEAVPAVGATFMRAVLDDQADFEMAIAQGQRLMGDDGQVRPEAVIEDPDGLVNAAEKVKGHFGKIMQFFDAVLLEDSQRRFAERLSSLTNPIELPQVYETYHWLVGRLSGRPTMPSDSSTGGPETTGTSSTAGVPPTE